MPVITCKEGTQEVGALPCIVPDPETVKPAAETIRELQQFFADTKISHHAGMFFANYCYGTPFYKVGFLESHNQASFTAVAWWDEKPFGETKDFANDISIFYPGDPDDRGFSTIQRYTWLSFMKMVMRRGKNPEDLVALVPPENRGSDKLIRARLEASLGTKCEETMALDYVYWVFTGKTWCWFLTEGEFLGLKI